MANAEGQLLAEKIAPSPIFQRIMGKVHAEWIKLLAINARSIGVA